MEYYYTMMENLRIAAKHVVIKIILSLIIISFILTGIGNYLIGGFVDYAAKVNGEVIKNTQLEQLFQSEQQRLQQELHEDFSALSDNKGYMKDLRKQVLSKLIDNILLTQYANKLGLIVSDEQIKNAIRNIPYFQTNGIFSNVKYLSILSSIGYTADNFAQSMRQQLMLQQLMQALDKSSFVLPTELQKMAALVLQQRNVRLATIEISKLQSNQKVSENELKTYYKEHQSKFIVPEQIKISYIPLNTLSIQEKINVSDAEIISYYEKHKISYTQPERKHYSVIQLKTETEANEVLNKLKQGGDFFILAKSKSIDILSRSTGGNIGWMEPETTDDDIKKAHLTEKGQLSTVLKSSIGYLIVRLNDIEPKKIKLLSDVQEDIVKYIRQAKSLNAYHMLQNKVRKAIINDNLSMNSIEKIVGIKATQTDWFTRDNIPTSLNFKPIVQSIFNNVLLDDNSMPVNNADLITIDSNRSFIIRITAYKAESIASFNQISDRIAEILQHNKALEKAKIQGEQILVELKKGTGGEAMKAAGISFGSIKKIVRTIGYNPLIETIFSLPHPGKIPIYGISQDSHENIVLFVLDAIVPRYLSEHEMKKFIKKMEETWSNATFFSLLSSLRKDAKIKLSSAEEY